MPTESYPTRWGDPVEKSRDELAEAVKQACVALRSDGHYFSAERLEAAHQRYLEQQPPQSSPVP